MGAVSGLLQRVVCIESFEKRQSGPTLRRLFGAYRNPDSWAVYRRFRAIDDGNGYVSYEELLQCVCLAEYQQLFLWETFSQQNELIHARELMTVICVFSSAPLVEKGKFLQALFDDSHTGLNTASEIVSILHMVLAVLTKCTGVPVKVKEVREQLKELLPDVLPQAWSEALERASGKAEVAFNTERFIGQVEMEQLLPSIQDTYETLPIAGPAPPGALQPPPPDWATPSSLEKGVTKVPEKGANKPANGASAKALSKAELAHLDWISKMDDEEEGMGNSQLLRTGSREPRSPPARLWMIIYGTDLAIVLKNLAKFRHLFMRSISSALGLPMGCVEIVNITRPNIIVEFLLQPSGRGNDTREAEALQEALLQQLALAHSALRKGPFKDYAASAELVERPEKGRKPQPVTPKGVSTSNATREIAEPILASTEDQDKDMQAKLAEKEQQMQEILKDLEASEAEARQWQTRAEDAIAERDKALEELAALRK
jgi:Ca2+-binding EF-hand superfamily protein